MTTSDDVHLRLGETDIDAVDDDIGESQVETSVPKPSSMEEASPTNTDEPQPTGTITAQDLYPVPLIARKVQDIGYNMHQ